VDSERLTLIATVLEELRARRIVCPPLPAIERLAGSVRGRAQQPTVASAHRRSERLNATVAPSFSNEEEKLEASVEDRQGLGVPRASGRQRAK
jgi:hypothetical protein